MELSYGAHDFKALKSKLDEQVTFLCQIQSGIQKQQVLASNQQKTVINQCESLLKLNELVYTNYSSNFERNIKDA